jgi:hypothetical protein
MAIFLTLGYKAQLSVSYVYVSPNPLSSRAVVNYSFSGTGTDTIGVHVVDGGFFHKLTLRSNYVVSAGLYQDSLIMDHLPDGAYRLVLTHGFLIFAGSFFVKSRLSSVPEWNPSTSWKIYPNPVKDKLTIESESQTTEEINASLFNVQGQEIFQLEKLEQQQTLELGELPSGLYLLKLQSSSGQETIKIIRE